MILNRKERRHLRKHADKAAALMAATAVQRNAEGRLAFLDNANAIAVVARGYRAFIHNSCRPVVLELTPEEGALLRGHGFAPPPPIEGVRHWAAFGVDVDGRGTFSTAWTCIKGASELEVIAESERIALEQLASACNVSGLPEGV